jgi:cysteine-rich repeat protein
MPVPWLRRIRSSLVPLLLGACGDDGAVMPAEGSSSDGGSTAMPGTTTVVDESSGTTTSAMTDASTDDTGFRPPEPACGNGYVEADEECDDGNAADDDGCTNACQVPCGLQWSTLSLGPTLDSEIEGLEVARGEDDQIAVAGRLREITVERDGTVIEGEDTVLVQSHAAMGGMVWERILASPDGDAFVGGVAVDAAGDVYVAASIDAADGGSAIQVTKLAAADGGTTWVHDFDGAFVGEDELASGIAVGPDGQPVIAGQVRAGDGDDDVWLRKLDAADGTEVWTQTHSGVGAGGFSTDDGGPLAIAPDGSIYVLARIYEDFQTQRGALLRFTADGGPAEWTFVPSIAGANQQFSLGSLTVGEDGLPVMSVQRTGGVTIDFWIYKVDADGRQVWSRERADFEVRGAGTDWILEGLASNGSELVVQGRYFNDQRLVGSTWWETWVTRLGPDGSPRCQVLQQASFRGLLPPSLLGYAVTTASDGSAVVTGAQTSSDEAGLWLGSFRD